MTANFTVTFRPRDNTDIITSIPILSETGPMVVPLECYTKKVKLSLSAEVVDFGPAPVTLGNSLNRWLKISNDGALDVTYSIRVTGGIPERRTSIRKGLVLDSSDRDAMTLAEEMQVFMDEAHGVLEGGPFTIYQYVGSVAGYSSTTIKINFAPVACGQRSIKVELLSKAVHQRMLIIDPLHFTLTVKPYLAVSRQVICFQT